MKMKINSVTHIEEHFIKQQGYKMDSIPEIHKRIQITGVISYGNGAIIENVPVSNVHILNKHMFLNINKIIGLNLSGIDFISTDIHSPYIGKVIEVNPGPSYSTDIQTEKINKKLIMALFNETKYEYQST